MATESVAVIQTGGKQYRVSAGDVIRVERLHQDAGSSVSFADILNGKTVTAELVGHGQGQKVYGRIFRNKVRARRYPRGHRQQYSQLSITTIV
ncbi:50S ribosomal protein L21 [Candidatus Berkelbacteria bacterium]|nr:50S ribosomal protein L21 [Candidatus Berkelbacteria bacterium]